MLSRIRERKVVQWLIAYTVVAWAILEAIELVSGALNWSTLPLRIGIILAVVGAPVVVVLGWYHGEKGRQKVTPVEAFILGALTLAGGITLVAFGRPSGGVASESREELTGEDLPALDSTRYAVLPFRHEDIEPAETEEEILLHDALGRWRGIQLVDFFQVRDATSRHKGVVDDDLAARIAARLGAGRFVVGSVARLPGGIRVHAVLLDTRTRFVLADTTMVLAEHSAFDDEAAAALASHLLFRGTAAVPSAEVDLTTTSFPARLSFLQGQEALQEWDLERADSLFARAISEDPTYTLAHLWRAQVRNWNDEDPQSMRTSIEIAVAAEDRLPDREGLLGRGLLALAREDFAGACSVYNDLRRANELDFAAWYGLGECRRRDSGVVRDRGSPTGWAFRSSYHSAVNAYERAFEILPIAHRGFKSNSFERVKELLFVSGQRIRQGRAVSPDTGLFMARPALVADTLSFVPLRLEDFRAGAPGSSPGTRWVAVERQRASFVRLAEGWVAAFPNSIPALRALALARELTGAAEALPLLRRARELSANREMRLQIMAEEIRLLVKQGGENETYHRAAALADTLMSADSDAVDPKDLAEIAALTGRATRAATHARQAAGAESWTVTIPAAVIRSAEALLAYSALGGPPDSLVAAEDLVLSGLRNRLPMEESPGLRRYLLDRPASLAFPTQPLTSTAELVRETDYPALKAQGLLTEGDTARALALIRGVLESRRHLRPGQVAIETVFAEAWVLAAAGAETEAAALLDATLESLRWAEPNYLGDVAKPAALVRAMALRAEIAAALGQRSVARRWGAAVAALWRNCDPHLRPQVELMNRLAAVED